MGLTLTLAESDAESIGENLQVLITGYSEAFPDLSLKADVSLVGLAKMQALNAEYRSLDEPTDVLSFPTLPSFEEITAQARTQETLIGSIVICPAKAEAYQETLPQLIHHGLLHLLGFDHDSDFPAWLAAERRILAVLQQHGLSIPPVPYATV